MIFRHIGWLSSRLAKHVSTRWYSLILFSLGLADQFLLFISLEAILISSTLIDRRCWARFAAALALGCAFGDAILAQLMVRYGGLIHLHTSRLPSWALQLISSKGVFALGILALGPLPIQPVVAFCALGGMSAVGIFSAILIARAIKFGILGWSTSHTHQLIRDSKAGRRMREQMELRTNRQRPHR